MRSRWMTFVAPAAALTLSCSDSTSPTDEELEHLVLAFCATELPVWFAYQNDGENWTRVQANVNNAFEFDASPRVAIAFTQDFDNQVFTDVYYTTVDEIRPLSGVACTETQGTKNVTGSVAGVAVGSRARVSLSGATDVVAPPTTGYILSGIPSDPHDLLGIRQLGAASVPTPDRVAIRRAIDPVNNAVLPVLDFSAEGQAIATHTATISGLLSGQDNYYDIEFSTASGTSDTVYSSPLFTSSSQTLYGVPSGLTQTGDAHRISMNADASNSYRTVIHWTRIPGDKAFALGSALSQPTVAEVATSTSYARMRTSLPAQTDYPSFTTAFFVQGAGARNVYVTVTAAYVNGAISTWTNEIPDFSSAGGYPTNAGLQQSSSTDWYVEAYDGSLPAFIGGKPVDGATVRYAGRGNVTSTMQMNVVGARGASNRREQLLRRTFRK